MKIVVFLITFGVYIFTAFPALAPYRDSGEMVSVIKTLGVAHPPGYPLYTLIGKLLTTIIPLSNFAYRVTVVSSLFMALAVLVMFVLLKKIFSEMSEILLLLISFSFSFSYLYWYLAVVQEMYTVSVFFVLLVLYFLITEKVLLAMFVLGVATGVRLDLVLIYPAVFYFIWTQDKRNRVKRVITTHLVFAVGFSVYLYLLVRSSAEPLINWNDPSTIARLISSLMRKTHGGTLDLISAGYAKGENFVAQLSFYFWHLFRDYFYIGLPIAALGIAKLFQTKRRIFWTAISGFLISGILFIYLANMPPNPHALAILEAHFLLPDLFFIIFLTAGVMRVFEYKKEAGYLCCIVLMFGNFFITFPELNKRNNFFLTDYTRNLSVSLPEDSVVVLKEDVQLFSMWEQKYVTKKRPDIKVVASGLSGSLWYQRMNRDGDVRFFPLSTADGWKSFIEHNKRVNFTNDVEFLLKDIKTSPQGLANTFESSVIEPHTLVSEFYIYRGDYRYHSYREFFTPDLIEEYAKAWHQSGSYYMHNKNYDKAKRCFMTSLYMKSDMPISSYLLGWCFFSENDFANAYRFYDHATTIYEKLIGLAKKYKAMPDVVSSIKNEAANAYLHKGVTAEKLGKDSEAISNYQKATELNPSFSLAYYNKAVIYWKRGDFNQARKNLELTLRYDPQNQTAQYYLHRLINR